MWYIDRCSESHNCLLHRTKVKNFQDAMKVDTQSNNSRAQKPAATIGELSKQAEHERNSRNSIDPSKKWFYELYL